MLLPVSGNVGRKNKMSKYAKYVDLIKATTTYGTRMRRLSNRIFNEVVRPTNNKSMKVVQIFQTKPLHKDEEIMHYYPRHVETHNLMMQLREYGLFRDEHQDFKEEMVRLRALRGKVKAKKGEGKKAQLKAVN